MKTQNFCQSCGMPMANEAMYGTNADGENNTEYCLYCYKSGTFTASISMEEMAAFCASHLLDMYKGLTKEEAELRMLDVLPALKRWRSTEIKEINCPKTQYIAFSGKGSPEICTAYGASYQVLYSVFAALQEICKTRGQSLPFAIPHTLWYSEEEKDLRILPRAEWLWCNMLELPSFVTKNDLNTAKEILSNLPMIENVHLEEMNEGNCLQVLHIGSYETMCDTVARLNETLAKKNCRKNGRHHDIYVSDPRTTPPAELTTLIRLPITN